MTMTAVRQPAIQQALGELGRIERAIDRAYEPICASLGAPDRAAVDKIVERLRDEVKSCLLEQHDAGRDAFARDMDLGFEARLQFRKTTTYDLPLLVETAEGKTALTAAAGNDMLRVAHGALAEFRMTNVAAWAEMLWSDKYRIETPAGAAALMLRRGWR